jgi:PAS domain S-box-containing protein
MQVKRTREGFEEGSVKEAVRHKWAETPLDDALEFREKIIAESPIGIAVYDESGQCVTANDSIGRLVGATKEQILRQNYNHVETWKQCGLFDKTQSAVRENVRKRHELKIESSFGREVSLDCHLVPFSSGGRGHLLLMINDISERKRIEEALEQRTHDLSKRIKELNCLYSVSSLLENPDISLPRITQGIIDLIPSCWQYPEVTCARIVINGQEFTTPRFMETAWKQAGDIRIGDKSIGSVEVFYTEERRQADEGPFLKEERRLIDDIAKRVGRLFEQRASRATLQLTLQTIPSGLFTVDLDRKITYWNQEAEVITGLKAEDAIGRDCLEAFDCEECKYECGLLNDAVEKPMYEKECTIHVDGGDITIIKNADVLKDFEGKIIGGLESFIDASERRKIEEAWHESEAKFRALVETTSDFIWEMDENGIYTYASPKVKDLLGYDPEEIIGKTPFDFMPVDEAKRVGEEFRNILELCEPFAGLENTNIHKDGQYVMLDSSGVPFFDESGHLLGYRGIDRDVSERKQAEEALRESEEFSSSLLMSASYPIVVVNPEDSSIIYVNAALENLTGFSFSELVGCKAPHPWCTDKTLEKTGRDQKRSMAKGAQRLEEIFQKKNGELFWVEITSSPIIQNDELKYYVTTWLDVTERKNAEEALRASKASLQLILQTIPSGLFMVDLDRKITYWNKEAEAITGLKAEDAIGRDCLEAFDCEECKKGCGLFNIGVEKPLYEKECTIHVDGRDIIITKNADLLTDAQRNVIGGLESFIDTTERKNMDAALRASEASLKLIFQTIPSGLFTVDLDRKITYWNKEAEAITGLKAEDAIGRDCLEAFDCEECKKGCGLLDEAVEKPLYEKECTIHVDGRDITITKNADVLRDFEGNVIGGLESFVDTTERRKAEEALRDSEEKYSTLVENSLTGIYIDDGGKIVFANEQFAEIYGYQKDELIGMESWKLVHPDDRPLTDNLRGRRLRGEYAPKDYEARGLTKDGRTIWLARRNTRIEYQGRAAILGNVEAVTQRREAEEKLRTYHEKLRSLASKLSLAEERQRRRVAVEVHDRISQNLAFIKMKLGTLKKSTPPDNLAGIRDEILKFVDETIQSTRTLISELGSPILYELGFVPAVEWLTGQVHDQHGIAVSFEDDGQPKPLSEEVRVLLFQASRELLVNIVKHAHAHTAKVSIRRHGDEVCVDVADDGVGFDSTEIGSSMDTTGRFGLFSIRVRLEPLGGYLGVHSEPGHGTRISLVAPLEPAKGDKEEKAS